MQWARSILAVAIAAAALLPHGAAAETPPALSDQAITDKIEMELLSDVAVPSYHIDVQTRDGIATLSGRTSNLLAQERAARIAATVRGVRAVVNTIEVTPRNRSNTDLRNDVAGALLANPAADSYQVETTVRDGRVTLTGNVDSWHEKQLAGKLAMGVRGVTAVDNQIRVVYDHHRSDTDIRDDVHSKLRWDRYIDDSLIDVEVEGGKVALSGIVGSAAEKTRARTLAWTAGVESVDDSRLEVQFWARDDKLRNGKYARRTDAETRKAVQDALVHDPRVSPSDVSASVVGRVVTLRGRVATLEAKRAAAQTARNTVGVERVTNLLKVRFPEPISDQEIATRIREALERDAYVERRQVQTSVFDGIAYLSGTVDSYFEKARAENLASSVSGVVDVRNNLVVTYPVALAYDPYVYDGYPYDYDWWSRGSELPIRVTKSDTVIEQDIEDQLWWSPFVDADEVQVEVDGGVATLRGTVDTWAERNAATENALEGGAVRVVNRLQINGVGS